MKLKNILKPIKIFAVMALLLTTQSCKDILDETVVSGIGNDYVNTPKGFEDAVKSAYSTLRFYYGTQQGLTLTEYGTDIYATGADGAYKGFHFYDTQLQPTVDYLGNTWDELYRGINTCNTVIDRAAAKNSLMASCLFTKNINDSLRLRSIEKIGDAILQNHTPIMFQKHYESIQCCLYLFCSLK